MEARLIYNFREAVRMKHKESFMTRMSKRLIQKIIDIPEIIENKTHKILYLPHYRETHLELLFLTVLAFPNASRTGFDCTQISQYGSLE